MLRNKTILAIIPARGGSKRLPRKNIKLLAGKPLISYAIKAARNSKYVDNIIVSTDDIETAAIATKYKAEVPFIRPPKLARDTSTTISVLQHAVRFLKKKNNYQPDLVVLLQPTSPFVLGSDIDRAIKTIEKTETNSCVSICDVSERPEWMFVFNRNDKDKVTPLFKDAQKVTITQKMPKVYRVNGAVYIVKKDVLMRRNKIIDDNCSAIIMPQERSIDIDTILDFQMAELMSKHFYKK